MTSKEADFIKYVAESKSIIEVLDKMGWSDGGCGYRRFHRYKKRLGADTSHFLSIAEMRTGHKTGRLRYKLETIMTENSVFPTHRLRLRLINEGVLENRCAKCGLGPEWNGEPLVLQLDHINGVNNDHRRHNLRLLCPNCHTQTDTYGAKNARR